MYADIQTKMLPAIPPKRFSHDEAANREAVNMMNIYEYEGVLFENR